MKTKKLTESLDIALLLSILIYILLAVCLLPHYQYQLNPDGISYMSIAQKYVSHDFSNAINGYWGPLISWLMVPFLVVGFTPLIAANLLLIIIGLTVIIQSNVLIKILNINMLLRFIVLSLIAIIVIYFVFDCISPDLLVVSISLALINKILDSSLRKSKYAGLTFGLIGSCLYLAKSFGFPFFLASFLTISLIFYYTSENLIDRRRIAGNFISGFIVFLIISGCWVLLISHKYGIITIGTAGSYNRVLQEPNSLGHPMFYAGLLDPPNSTAISIWEDVASLKIKSWSIFDSYKTIIMELRVICRNLLSFLPILNEISFLSLSILLTGFVYLLQLGRQLIFDKLFYLLLILGIMFLGYTLIAFDPRYTWLGNIIILIIGTKLLNLLFEKIPMKKISRIILIGFFIISFLVLPISSMYNSLNSGKPLFELSTRLTKYNIHGRIASSNDWESSYYVSFHNGWQYYGRSRNSSESDVENELKNKSIDYYIVWESSENKINFLEKYPEITGGNIAGLKIYKLK
jgi:hypothetical protein